MSLQNILNEKLNIFKSKQEENEKFCEECTDCIKSKLFSIVKPINISHKERIELISLEEINTEAYFNSINNFVIKQIETDLLSFEEARKEYINKFQTTKNDCVQKIENNIIESYFIEKEKEYKETEEKIKSKKNEISILNQFMTTLNQEVIKNETYYKNILSLNKKIKKELENGSYHEIFTNIKTINIELENLKERVQKPDNSLHHFNFIDTIIEDINNQKEQCISFHKKSKKIIKQNLERKLIKETKSLNKNVSLVNISTLEDVEDFMELKTDVANVKNTIRKYKETFDLPIDKQLEDIKDIHKNIKEINVNLDKILLTELDKYKNYCNTLKQSKTKKFDELFVKFNGFATLLNKFDSIRDKLNPNTTFNAKDQKKQMEELVLSFKDLFELSIEDLYEKYYNNIKKQISISQIEKIDLNLNNSILSIHSIQILSDLDTKLKITVEQKDTILTKLDNTIQNFDDISNNITHTEISTNFISDYIASKKTEIINNYDVLKDNILRIIIMKIEDLVVPEIKSQYINTFCNNLKGIFQHTKESKEIYEELRKIEFAKIKKIIESYITKIDSNINSNQYLYLGTINFSHIKPKMIDELKKKL